MRAATAPTRNTAMLGCTRPRVRGGGGAGAEDVFRGRYPFLFSLESSSEPYMKRLLMLTGRVDSVHKREHALCALQSESPSPARARPTVSRPTPSPDAHDSLRARPLNLGAFPQAADRRSHLRSLWRGGRGGQG